MTAEGVSQIELWYHALAGCGRWETQMKGASVQVLGFRWGDWALPIVLAVLPR